jgi:hypothetical protein
MEFILRKCYRGDFLDRCNFGLEILTTIMKLYLVNNVSDDISEWKIYANSSNHEEYDIYSRYGFMDEINITLNNRDNYSHNYKFLSLLSSALVVNIGEKTYLLCHGGFSVNYTINSFKHNSLMIIYCRNKIATSIRCSDFGLEYKHVTEEIGNGYVLTSKQLDKFGDNFIIRGYTYNGMYTMLLFFMINVKLQLLFYCINSDYNECL